MSRHFFVTGTDTDAGKTLISAALLLKASQAGLACFGLKPVAAGGIVDGCNDDAVQLMQASNVALPYQQVNPILFGQPIAPHIAAQLENRRLSVRQLAGFVRGALSHKADFKLVEGAGGWLVPLNEREYLSGLAKELQLPVILVVGIKLGCLNHTLLTLRAISQDGVPVAGWVGTQLEENMPVLDENIQSLKNKIAAPCLGIVPFDRQISAEKAADYLQLAALLDAYK